MITLGDEIAYWTRLVHIAEREVAAGLFRPDDFSLLQYRRARLRALLDIDGGD